MRTVETFLSTITDMVQKELNLYYPLGEEIIAVTMLLPGLP
jgi:hypothetical protein